MGSPHTLLLAGGSNACRSADFQILFGFPGPFYCLCNRKNWFPTAGVLVNVMEMVPPLVS